MPDRKPLVRYHWRQRWMSYRAWIDPAALVEAHGLFLLFEFLTRRLLK